MRKFEMQTDEKEVRSYIEELRKDPFLQDISVDLGNVNECARYASECRHCADCKGLDFCLNTTKGYHFVNQDGYFVLEECDFQKEQVLKSKSGNMVETLFISKALLNANLENYDLKTSNRQKIFNYIQTFIQHQKNHTFCKGLYIYGNYATGKTYTLGCIANELAKNHIPSTIVYFPDLVVELKNLMGTEKYAELLTYLKEVDVLILDDVGAENMTLWLRDEVISPIVNYRLSEQKPLFISSNLEPKQELQEHFQLNKTPLEKKSAQRIISRFEGLYKGIELDNSSYPR